MSTTYKRRHRIKELENKNAQLEAELLSARANSAHALQAAEQSRSWLGALIEAHVRLRSAGSQRGQTYQVNVEVSEEMLMMMYAGEDVIARELGRQIANKLKHINRPDSPVAGMYLGKALDP